MFTVDCKAVSEFYRQLALELVKQPIVLATVIQISGAVSSSIGAKMFICANGKSVGTIGSDTGEAQIYAQALQVLATGMNAFAEIDLSEACSGQMRVWLERWDKHLLPLTQQILIALETGNPVAIVTPFDQTPYLIPEVVDRPQLTAMGCFIEPLEPMHTLLIVGAGQIAVPLAQMAHMTEFRVIIVDDRIELTTVERFPHAICRTTSIDVALRTLSQAKSRYAVLMTDSSERDITALRPLLAYSMQYTRIIGSHNRSQQVFQTLVQQGYTADQIAAIHTSIDFDVVAQTPTEIAVNICAEIIQIRRNSKVQGFR